MISCTSGGTVTFRNGSLLVRLVHRMGLAQAVPLLVAVSLAILLPVILFGVGRVAFDDDRRLTMRDRRVAAHDDADRLTTYAGQAQALRSLHFWSVSLPFALALAAQVGFIVHQVAFLLPRLGSAGAGTAIAATAVAAALGRLAFAPLIDHLNQRIAAAASFASQAAGLGLMLALKDTVAGA